MPAVARFIAWLVTLVWRFGVWLLGTIIAWTRANWRTVWRWIESGISWITIVDWIRSYLGY